MSERTVCGAYLFHHLLPQVVHAIGDSLAQGLQTLKHDG